MQLDYVHIFTIAANMGKSVSAILIEGGLKRGTITRIKAGKPVTSVTAGLVSKALGVPVEQLIKQ